MKIDAPPILEDTTLSDWLYRFWQKSQEDHLYGSATWDAASIANGAEEATTVSVTGAEVGDMALASLSIDISDLVLDAQVTAADTVTVVLANNTGGAIDLASATVYVRVFRRVS